MVWRCMNHYQSVCFIETARLLHGFFDFFSKSADAMNPRHDSNRPGSEAEDLISLSNRPRFVWVAVLGSSETLLETT